jgi:hypothetical protein
MSPASPASPRLVFTRKKAAGGGSPPSCSVTEQLVVLADDQQLIGSNQSVGMISNPATSSKNGMKAAPGSNCEMVGFVDVSDDAARSHHHHPPVLATVTEPATAASGTW